MRRRRGLYSPIKAVALGMIASEADARDEADDRQLRHRGHLRRQQRQHREKDGRGEQHWTTADLVGDHREHQRPQEDAEVARGEHVAEHRPWHAPFLKNRRRHVADHLDVKAVKDETRRTQHEEADLQRSDTRVVDDVGDLDCGPRSRAWPCLNPQVRIPRPRLMQPRRSTQSSPGSPRFSQEMRLCDL